MTIRARFKRRWGDFTLDVDFTAPAKGVTGVFGPSGSGKTSLLRCIAGLEHATGTFSVGEDVWQDQTTFRPAHRRPVGYVFQEASLFAHLSVRGNLEYGLKRAQTKRPVVSFDQAVELLGLDRLLVRDPATLSGGERQRAAMARALLSGPELLLMDEPLASLDLASKQEIMPFLERLHRELDIPVFYVSHAPAEIARMADYLVMIEAGRITTAGAIEDVWARMDIPLMGEPGAESIITAQVVEHDDHYQLTSLEFSGGRLTVSRMKEMPGCEVRVIIPARDVSLALEKPASTSIQNILPAVVESVAGEGGAHSLVVLQIGTSRIISRITRKSADGLGLKPGMNLYAQIKTVGIDFNNSVLLNQKS